MSGGPPHHPHGRQVPAANPAWNHLQSLFQVPNYFPSRQPQHAHMSTDHTSFLHQPTWHTPTTDTIKTMPHSHLFGLEQMLSDRQFAPRHAPGVDLSVTRNGSQNGDLPTSPISLSVRDANKINSLPPGALDVQPVELTRCPSPGPKSASPGLVLSPTAGLKSTSPGLMSSSSPGLMSSSSPGLTTSSSPGLKSTSPGLMSTSGGPGLKSLSPGLSTVLAATTITAVDPMKNFKRSNKRVDSILERLNPTIDKLPVLPPQHLDMRELERPVERLSAMAEPVDGGGTDRPQNSAAPPGHSVIVQPNVASHDENSSSSSVLTVPTPTNPREDDVLSPCSNEDSLDSSKSRRKRKPSKTVRMSSKEDDHKAGDSDNDLAKTLEESIMESKPSDLEPEGVVVKKEDEEEDDDDLMKEDQMTDDHHMLMGEDDAAAVLGKTRRKTSSESETIDNIAAMVQEAIEEKKSKIIEEVRKEEVKKEEEVSKPVTVSVIKTKDNLQETLAPSEPLPKDPPPPKEPVNVPVPPSNPTPLLTPAQKKATNTHFVEVENKLEEMFAGIDDNDDPLKTDHVDLGDDSKMEDDSLLKLDDSIPSTSQDVTSTSNEPSAPKTPQKKPVKKTKVKAATKRSPEATSDTTPKKKKPTKKTKLADKCQGSKASIAGGSKAKNKKPSLIKQSNSKADATKDIYAYDSGSNTSSTKSKGPFIHIKGPRDSPISVNVVNTPTLDEDSEKKSTKTKKYHDDSEYRHKVRSKGLHSSTLSNKYDAQTRDVSWICAFCKRGPHGSHQSEASQRTFDVALGDLFGPYFIGTTSAEFEQKLDDPYDKQFKSKKTAKMIDLTAQPVKVTGKKVKRKYSDSFENRSSTEDNGDIFVGITDTGNKSYEVWAHEDCIVWSPGVYLVGSKIMGLEEAVWTSCNVVCNKCKSKGANICCLNRGCTKVLHYCCAKSSDWVLDEVNFKAYCSIHKITP